MCRVVFKVKRVMMVNLSTAPRPEVGSPTILALSGLMAVARALAKVRRVEDPGSTILSDEVRRIVLGEAGSFEDNASHL